MKTLTISLLGIDGSGKSTLAKSISKELQRNGISVKVIPFHKWLFADRLRGFFWTKVDSGRSDLDIPYHPAPGSIAALMKPIVALIDNILFYKKKGI